MSYRTDMVEQILISPEAQTILEYLSPIYGESYVGLWLLQVIGMQLDKASNWTAEMAMQVTPQTATWALDFWEKEYGIIPVDDWTIEQRRQNVIAHMKLVAPMNPTRLEEIASLAAGVPVQIIENTGKNHFTVFLRDYLKSFDRLYEVIDEAKPAHLIYSLQVALQIPTESNVYAGVGVSMFQRFNIKVDCEPPADNVKAFAGVGLSMHQRFDLKGV